MRHVLSHVANVRLGKVFADLAEMEDILRESGLDWTVVRPPQLTGKPFTGTYRTVHGQNLRGGLSVPRADVATSCSTSSAGPTRSTKPSESPVSRGRRTVPPAMKITAAGPACGRWSWRPSSGPAVSRGLRAATIAHERAMRGGHGATFEEWLDPAI